MVSIVDILSVFLVTTVSSLFEESSRVKAAKSIVLIGETLIVLSILNYLLDNIAAYFVLLIPCLALAIVSTSYSLRKLSDLVNDVILDTYLCLYVGENCRDIFGEEASGKNPVELVISKFFELLTGKWSPVEESMRVISETKIIERF